MVRTMPVVFCLAIFCTVLCGGDESAKNNKKKKILAFGGNGMIGSEVVHMMLEDGGYDITMVSRGSWHFDSAVRVKPFVRSFVCDRSKEAHCAHEQDCDVNTLKNCTDLMKVINETELFHAVLDFSAYEAKWIHDAVHVLKDKTRVYVYISTDSVYEVSTGKPSRRPSKETDAVRPDDVKKRKELKDADRYGDAKLAGEEALVHQRRREEEGENGEKVVVEGIPWVALRFADVIGPRDTTDRWSLYQTWIKFYHALEIPVYVPTTVVGLKQSLTYVNDAAQSVMLAVEKGPEVWDQAYNIAMEEEVTLWDTVQKIAGLMGVEGVEQDNSASDRSFHFYPTVFSGPIDISKAKETLGFIPTPIDEAFKTTIAWYEDNFVRQDAQREEVLSRLITYVVPREKKDKLYIAVEAELEKHGIVNERYRKKRKGDVGEVPDEHEEL